MAAFDDGYWWSNDGLRLHYRDYPGRDDRPAILCLPGLTRNARDFAAIGERLAGEWRVICVELRGRGESGYAKDAMSYVPLIYLQDVTALIAQLGVARIVPFGTSLGGILAMLLAATDPERIAGALLNDIGPVIEPEGLGHIRSYAGKAQSWPTWLHAAHDVAELHRSAFPGYGLEDWLAAAKRTCKLTPAGRIVLDYDMRIAEPFRLPGGDGALDLWPAYAALAARPLAIVHGARSTILSAATAAEMARRAPDAELLTLTDVGHAPMLTEEGCEGAIDRLLAKIK